MEPTFGAPYHHTTPYHGVYIWGAPHRGRRKRRHTTVHKEGELTHGEIPHREIPHGEIQQGGIQQRGTPYHMEYYKTERYPMEKY